jgi:hypothetical protein
MAESTDGGASWSIIENTPGIGEGDGMVMADSDTWFWGQGFGGIYRTTNRGTSWEHVTTESAGFRFIQKADDGNWYSSGYYGVLQSSDGISWSHVENGPKSHSIATGNGFLFTSWMDTEKPYWSAPVSDPTNWTEIVTPSENIGSWQIRFDTDHNLLYTTSANSGFWRVRTQ